MAKTQSIIIDEILEADLPFGGYPVSGENWKAFHTTVSIDWLKSVFEKYNNKGLFSANIRDYMGNVEINEGIRHTCTEDSDNFWIYNNGISCLVHKFDYDETRKRITLTGLSIINGAQTTGAVGSSTVIGSGYLPVRFVTLDNATIWQNMITYNNSQNKILPSDFRSNDEVQQRLRQAFKLIPDTEYLGRRSDPEGVIQKKSNLISTEKAAIALFAFHGEAHLTYHKRKEIWEKENYSRHYNHDLSAAHLVFTYSLIEAIEEKKNAFKNSQTLTRLETEQYEFMKRRGGMRIYLSAIGQSMEEILGKPILMQRNSPLAIYLGKKVLRFGKA